MTTTSNETPTIQVSDAEFSGLKDGTTHLFTLPLTEEALSNLPKAYADSTGTILIFPVMECPKEYEFRTGSGESCRRSVVNIMAYKEEDGKEVIKIRLK